MDEGIVPVGGTVGILGGGQLGRMMALAGRAMGLHTLIWDPDPLAPAAQAADDHIVAPYDSISALSEFAARIKCATYEFENVHSETAQQLSQLCSVYPPPELLQVSQHRLVEKDSARALGLATTLYGPATSPDEALNAVRRLGVPGLFKTVSGGYDGKGQALVESVNAVGAAYQSLQGHGDLMYERWVEFQTEVSVVVARDRYGKVVTYPVTENHHRRGILDWSVTPAEVSSDHERLMTEQARDVAEGLNLVGVMALEFFVTADGRVLFNEMAPRPHNSGHWTIEGAWPSQFTQHMRAIAGWSVATPRFLSPTLMMNLLGDGFVDGFEMLPRVMELEGVQLHWYGKKDMRPGRKVGHVTIVGDCVPRLKETAEAVRQILGGRCNDGA
ncbi:MAG: 5-(carboxyamino)imidazole ribonucleotide synthase [Sulfobacillus acidophilus]|uniref:N5-carboxyaminoimidazole ribonucleotide synthase n=1 Tax=Sulfobacillus acidophilus TaxID=53633 RepID=A0A2T2WP97_9FIRM|nr:MAG: 5-(carboxyamino)imidazole ribonucleotide synthase [Sulfobacillus acidophilus]